MWNQTLDGFGATAFITAWFIFHSSEHDVKHSLTGGLTITFKVKKRKICLSTQRIQHSIKHYIDNNICMWTIHL